MQRTLIHSRIGLCVIVVTATLLVVSGNVFAGIYTFQPRPADLWNLDHFFYYTWGIDWTMPAGERITSATLTIENLNDWKQPDEGNHLFVHLLPGNEVSKPNHAGDSWVRVGIDLQWPSDAFGSRGFAFTPYVDAGPGEETLTYKVPDAELSWLETGRFGFGFDPDCNYWNDGVKLTITTASASAILPIPVPAAVLLAGLGLGLVGGWRRFRSA